MKIKSFLNDSGFVVSGMAIVKIVDSPNLIAGWVLLCIGFILYMVGNLYFDN